MIHTFSRIYHPTDFSQGSQTAFEHSLRLALNAQGTLRLVHVGEEESPDWAGFPGVRFTLERWGLLSPGSLKSDVLNLGLEVQKFFMSTKDSEKAIASDISRKNAELVVMATHARQGLGRLLHTSVFKHVLRSSKKPILVVPHGVSGFVEPESGRCHLRRVLIPVSPEVHPNHVVHLANRFFETLEAEKVEARFLYVGEKAEAPALQYRDSERVHWEYVTRTGEVVRTISGELASFAPQLIIMLERGRNSVMDYLIPGKLERLTGESDCPLLVQNILADSR